MVFILKNKKMIKKYAYKSRKRVEKEFDQNLISQKLLKFIQSFNQS